MRAFRIAYDGRPFHGFQRQPNVSTVEDAVLDALAELGVTDPDAEDRTPPGYAAAGRTDAGVSAVGQTVAFSCPEWCSPRALNSELPPSVRAWASVPVPDNFHATHDATSRTYRYHLYAPDLSLSRTRAVLDRLTGTRDYHNLTPDETGTERDVEGSVAQDGDFLVVTLSAGGFARELVRRMVGLLRDVASGASDESRIGRVFGPVPLDGPAGVAPAPATPLVLTDVTYPAVSFERDPEAVRSLREVFADRRVSGLTSARVAGDVLAGVEE